MAHLLFFFLKYYLLLLLIIQADGSDSCAGTFSSAAGTSLEEINGKCIVATKQNYKTSGGSSAATTCTSIGVASGKKMYPYVPLSIDSKAENDHVKDGMAINDIDTAYNGLVLSGLWQWINGDSSSYSNWAKPPVTQPPTPGTTTVPFRSTLPPSQQRRSTAVVIGIDASLFSTSSLTFAQLDFARSLSTYIAERGPAEFAIFAYGCTVQSPYIVQYPNFVRTFDDTDAMISNVNEMIIHDCVRSNPLDFKGMFRDQTVYYNRYSRSYRPFKSKFLSMIYFSSSTDSDNIKAAISLYPITNSTVITVNVGNSSIDISRLSIPVWKYGFRVNTTDDIMGLVPKIDAIIFGDGYVHSSIAGLAVKPEKQEQNEQKERKLDYSVRIREPSNLATSYEDCAYMNATDGLWYSDGSCATKRQILCQYVLPQPPQPPTPNPTFDWQDPCYFETTNFTYFQILENSKCYRMSVSKKQFAEAENVCISNHPLFLHTPRLTSVESADEEAQLRTLVANITSEGMFWFGLKRDPVNSTNWYFINGDIYDASYSNWRDGYPRDADGCDCVAMVVNDNKWINTDCNKSLYSICAFRFNVTDKAF
ncbi:Protein CBR-CLEC-205 [Caenorhabditis briggsae]|uniref:Protein CBR-CLEC-205 n=3 Tax=Caenorhabditis briggsae TaxID=6238 RepID=A8WLE2_CAEBR|nr:Protein CBR-CLEC-205 [Caenorhabditis briggsae]ULT86856.1 hypothetical protein L3Y34_006526 [Caenorhabditis briggsae]CAP21287.2 Protein CBR-CLEC-205 [Caenorhabditis briggsae]